MCQLQNNLRNSEISLNSAKNKGSFYFSQWKSGILSNVWDYAVVMSF